MINNVSNYNNNKSNNNIRAIILTVVGFIAAVSTTLFETIPEDSMSLVYYDIQHQQQDQQQDQQEQQQGLKLSHNIAPLSSIRVDRGGSSISSSVYLILLEQANPDDDKDNKIKAKLKSRRILFVDDENDITLTYKTILEHHGFHGLVDVYNDPKQALENFKVGYYGLIILDIVMPEMNGFELFGSLRKLDKNVKVLFTTALGFSYEVLTRLYPLQNDNDSSHIEAILGGRFLTKPVDLSDLIKRVGVELN